MKLESMRDIDRVYVFKGERLAGILSRTRDGSSFEYDPRYVDAAKDELLDAVAFTLPLSERTYQTSGDNLPPFFAGLLPEGRRLTALIAAVKTSPDDLFTLLAASGIDCIGDIFVTFKPSLPEAEPDESLSDLKTISFSDLFEKSIASRTYAARLRDGSVPGIHPKISAEMISFPVALKKKNRRHLLKLAPEQFPKLVENEHFFMSLARECGLRVAGTTVVYDRTGASGLLVERFDRVLTARSRQRLHQEDACQFLGYYPQDKYRLALREIADGMNRLCTSPAEEIVRLLELVAFSYIVGNGDLHAKNISLLVESGRVVLAPAYDLVSTLPYGDVTMALHLEGRRDRLRVRDFVRFAERLKIKPKAVQSMLTRLTEVIPPKLEQLNEIGLEERKLELLRRRMEKRLKELTVER